VARADGLADGVARLRRALRRGARVASPGNPLAVAQDGRAIELTATDAGQQAVHAWQATNAAVLHLAVSALPEPQQRALAAAVPAIDALARAIDRLADTPPADDGPR